MKHEKTKVQRKAAYSKGVSSWEIAYGKEETFRDENHFPLSNQPEQGSSAGRVEEIGRIRPRRSLPLPPHPQVSKDRSCPKHIYLSGSLQLCGLDPHSWICYPGNPKQHWNMLSWKSQAGARMKTLLRGAIFLWELTASTVQISPAWTNPESQTFYRL